ncbi:heparinase II/III family protein [Lachnoclostridium pacaense]|uniref:alginate lyase family protein n=1 Tax=Enterocloster hominis (ex Hitch et al. 2024) TaxID=1917870 RepID=UPI001D1203A4|nr:alginate lyase family protein [Lachnoclostridium pacaense]MCC2820940.1 heparinase II/III family protein [Lachnoclostridium pacaense]
MTPRQWRFRLYYTIRNKLIKRKVKHVINIESPRKLPLNYAANLNKKSAIAVADDICKNSFVTISGIIKKFDWDIDWDLKTEEYRLVCFRLNSFKWLLDLSDAYKYTGNLIYVLKGFQLIDNWYKANGDIITGDKWNPYVTAERVMNWIGFCSEYCDLCNRNILLYANKILEQAIELSSSIEYHLGANHLLSEGKALIVAGAFLNNRKIYSIGKKLLTEELKVQFLDDGGHYERSISYHVESLQQYFESIAVMQICKDPQVESWINNIKNPYKYLNGMIDAAGRIPLVNDSADDYPFYNAADFLATAERLYNSSPPYSKRGEYYKRWNFIASTNIKIFWDTNTLYRSTGYLHYRFNIRGINYSFIMDVGNAGPDSNLGHAHADALNVLLASSTKEILVDSGVFTYKPGRERNECRSTKAHNTIELDGQNSAEIWSAFRVGKRGHSKIITYNKNDDSLVICAMHDGYRKCLKHPAIHERHVLIMKEDGTIQIQDVIIAKHPHLAISRFHIGAENEVVFVNPYTCCIDNKIQIICSLPIELSDCYISDLFGVKKKAKCLEIFFRTNEIDKITTTIIFKNKE